TSFMLINPDGSVFGCNRSYRNLGNVIESSVREVWNNCAYRKFRAEAFYELPKGKSSLADCSCYDCGVYAIENREIYEWGYKVFRWSPTLFHLHYMLTIPFYGRVRAFAVRLKRHLLRK
ncbi:MAG: SPASM domain-containing protein, partial [Candidatus Omnitrophica bacterium]|nr:SPASM domain-containing protein [Candidatus Omnitrophota bacterium]